MSNYYWDERFMDIARTVALWSKDPSSKCGATIIDGRRIVSTGYNGFAPGVVDSYERYIDREYKYNNILHCEENAIILSRECLHGYSIYLTGMTCSRCTPKIIAAGIKQVIIPCKEEDAFFYRGDWQTSFDHAKEQLTEVGINLLILEPTGFDPTKLMGPEHPYVKKQEEEFNRAKSECIKKAYLFNTD